MNCPICAHENNEFFPGGIHEDILQKLEVIGGGYRKNVLCPSCNSVDRERLLYMYLENIIEIPKKNNYKILHIAPERNIRKYLKSFDNIEYLSADAYREDVDKNIDIIQIPEENNTFDLVICNHVLEHILDDKKAMSEILRILKPKGIAILQVPISFKLEKTFEDSTVIEPSDRLKIFGQEDHVRIYGKDYLLKLKQVGFEVEKFDWKNNQIFKSKEYGFIKNEILFISHKR